MARRSQPHNLPKDLAQEISQLLDGFSEKIEQSDLREQVRSLIPAFHKLRDLGSSLIPLSDASNARERILVYFQRYPQVVIDADELMVVSGIGEWARRVRELRVQFGWWIYSGVTFNQIAEEEQEHGSALPKDTIDYGKVKPDQYVLMKVEQDRDAAYRWNLLNEIRRQKSSVKDKLIAYLRKNVQKPVSGEELRYLAKDRNEWPRRIRELRTEEGWPISSCMSGRDDLPVGVYVLEADRQAEVHDRRIPDHVRVAVLKRDGFACTECGWNRSMASPDDPRKFLELHHKKFHQHKGANTVDNLITLCNVDHDKLHRLAKESERDQ